MGQENNLSTWGKHGLHPVAKRPKTATEKLKDRLADGGERNFSGARGTTPYIQHMQNEIDEEQDRKDQRVRLPKAGGGGQTGRQYRNKGVIRGGSRRPESDFNTNTGPGAPGWGELRVRGGGLLATTRGGRPSKGREQDQREANLAAFVSAPQTKKDTEESMKRTYGKYPNIQNMEKAVYEYINKSKGNPGKGKKGRAAYKQQQQRLYDRMPPFDRDYRGRDLDHEWASREAYDKALRPPRPGAHPPGEEYRYFGYDTDAEGQAEYDKHYSDAMKKTRRWQVKGGAEKPGARLMRLPPKPHLSPIEAAKKNAKEKQTGRRDATYGGKRPQMDDFSTPTIGIPKSEYKGTPQHRIADEVKRMKESGELDQKMQKAVYEFIHKARKRIKPVQRELPFSTEDRDHIAPTPEPQKPLPHGDDLPPPTQRGGSRQGSRRKGDIPKGGWKEAALLWPTQPEDNGKGRKVKTRVGDSQDGYPT